MASPQKAQAFSLVYISRATTEFSPADEDRHKKALTSIAVPAEAKNRRLHVRGILLFAAGYFIQWLEGAEDVVRTLMVSIAADPRHTDLDIIYSGNGPSMLTEWSMSLVTRADQVDSIVRQIQRLRGGIKPKTNASVPAAMLLSIIRPSAESGVRRRRIALMGQSGIWPAALLEHLSRQFDTPVVHTRLLSTMGFERKAMVEFLDISHPEHGCLRLLNYSGDVVSLSWMSGIEDKLAACVLFYSHNSPQALTVFSAAVEYQLGNASRFTPLLCLFGRTAAPLVEPVLDWFAANGRPVFIERMSLADSGGVWAAIEGLLEGRGHTDLPTDAQFAPSAIAQHSQPGGLLDMSGEPVPAPALMPGRALDAAAADALDGRKVAQREADTALPVLELAAIEAPALERPAAVPAAPAAPPAVALAATPAPAALPASPPAVVLSAAGKQLFTLLLELDALRFAGAQCLASGRRVALTGSAFDAADGRGLSQEAFYQLLDSEALLHQSLLARMPPGAHADGPQLLTRAGGSFDLSFTVALPAGVVVVLHMDKGYANEALVRFSVLAMLAEPIADVFAAP